MTFQKQRSGTADGCDGIAFWERRLRGVELVERRLRGNGLADPHSPQTSRPATSPLVWSVMKRKWRGQFVRDVLSAVRKISMVGKVDEELQVV